MFQTVLPVHQARSRESLNRLLKATVEVLDKYGLEGATVPRIAACAGVSPGTIYRRFPDKDALLREVCLRTLESNYQVVSHSLAPERWQGKPLADMVRLFIDTTLKGHRSHRGLARALLFFTLQHADKAFTRKSAELRKKTFDHIAGLLLSRREEIRHPRPEAAVRFAMLMVSFAAQGTTTLPRNPADMSRFLPDIENQFDRELPQMVLRFLGIEE